jgi:ATP-dependent DNA helicase RecQ
VLLGETEDERIVRLGHDKLSTFGIGREHDRREWQSFMRQLVATNLLAVDNAEHGAVKITPRGHAFLRNRETLRLRAFEKPVRSRTSRRSSVPTESVAAEDGDLYAKLKALRLDLAREQNVAAFVIFHDRVLREIAAGKPKSRFELSQISGIGARKLEAYGDAVLAVIAAHQDGPTEVGQAGG